MIKAKVSADYKDIDRIFAGGSIQKEIIKVWSTEADAYVFEAWKILEMEGPLPLTLKANGEPLIDYRIYGNTEQTGTPTPENPIMPSECGEKTENLWNKDEVARIQVTSDNSIVRHGIAFSGSAFSLCLISDSDMYYKIKTGDTYGTPTQLSVGEVKAITLSNNQTLLVYGGNPKVARQAIIQINSGATILPYEPYGYKLPILSNSTVTNIYLGESQTTRRIKKLVLNGTENWGYNVTYNTFSLIVPNLKTSGLRKTTFFCNHYIVIDDGRPISNVPNNAIYTDQVTSIYIMTDAYTSVTDFKSYLQQQYAAGTPVTVWYVLAEPETGIVNEPLMKIGDYADTIDSTQANVQIPTSKGTTIIDYDGEKHLLTSDGYELVDKNQNGFLLSGSTLRPSKMYIKYKGR